MADTAVDLLLENLKQLINYDEDQIKPLYEELLYLRTFLKDSEENKDVVTQIIDLGFEAEDIITSSLEFGGMLRPKNSLGDEIYHPFCPYRILGDVIQEMKSINKVLTEIHDKKLYGTTGVPQTEVLSSHGSSSNLDEEIVVGFEQEAEMIKEQLVGEPKRLEIISIVGMPGSGKTTLATKLYNDPFIIYHFYIRAWIYVSQEYRKRDLLLGILTSILGYKEIYPMSDEKLGEELYRRLKGKRYFIVMDDIWHTKVWNDLRNFFPNDNNGSRIMFTSRHKKVALSAKPHSPPHFLCLLTEEKSWDLLQLKVFWKETCPPDLMEIGKQIAKKCQGLPLAIVVVAGLLAKMDKTQDSWNQVAESVSSYLVSDPKHCFDTLALSYNHLPNHLKSCFLYFGAFPEDCEIPVQKLIWLWIAEGFIHQTGQKNLEDVGVEYLMDLIDRSLVLVAKKRSAGGIRACRVHDLLRDFCLRKAEEENFLEQIYSYEEVFSFFSSPRANTLYRLSIHSRVFNCLSSESSAPQIRSCLCYLPEQIPLALGKMTVICQAFQLLRILDLSSIPIRFLPEEIEHLVHLRYLALQIASNMGLEPIFKLWDLVILSISTGKGYFGGGDTEKFHIPCTFWKMAKLRHIHLPEGSDIKLRTDDSIVASGACYPLDYLDDIPSPSVSDNRQIMDDSHLYPSVFHNRQTTDDLYPSVLDNLQTISLIQPFWSSENVLARTPNLKKLGFCGNFLIWNEGDLELLNHLETLKLSNTVNLFDNHPNLRPCTFQWDKFPPNLKKLTLENTLLEWKEMSGLGMLPNLEVLKLRHDACIGPQWETSDGQFNRLKFLELEDLDFAQWNTSNAHFPSLQNLVLYKCPKLEEIPSSLGDIPTLQIIELRSCSHSAVNSAMQIQEEQQSMGNNWLNILINRFEEEHTTYVKRRPRKKNFATARR